MPNQDSISVRTYLIDNLFTDIIISTGSPKVVLQLHWNVVLYSGHLSIAAFVMLYSSEQ